MNRAEVLAVYGDDDFAEGYDERFLLAAWPKHGADVEIELLKDLLAGDATWVDLCCGTGWFLSQFPDVTRAGLDISPAMLNQARAANPGVTFRQGDVCEPVQEWQAKWSVVSCMWMAYCYLESMPEVEKLIANAIDYTAEGGAVFLPSVIDLEDLRPHTQVPYEEYPDVWGGRIALTGYNWTWEEPNGNVNANMMAVHVGHFVRLLEPYFTRIEVVRYPLFGPGHVSRKAVVATGRRPRGETGSAEVVWQPIPRHPDDIAAEEERLRQERIEAERAEQAEAERVQAIADNEAAWAENATAWADNDTAWAEHQAHTEAETARADEAEAEVVRLWAEVARLSEAHDAVVEALRAAEANLAERDAAEQAAQQAAEENPPAESDSLETATTGAVARELRSRAGDGRVWRSVRRRAGRLLGRS